MRILARWDVAILESRFLMGSGEFASDDIAEVDSTFRSRCPREDAALATNARPTSTTEDTHIANML